MTSLHRLVMILPNEETFTFFFRRKEENKFRVKPHLIAGTPDTRRWITLPAALIDRNRREHEEENKNIKSRTSAKKKKIPRKTMFGNGKLVGNN